MNTTIKLRRDTSVNWESINPVLAEAELGVELNTSKVKLGDGTTPWNDLDYLIGKEEILMEDRPELIWEWEVTTDQSNTLDLPLDGLYNCIIDWGDGSALETVSDVTKPSHVYSSPGRYTVVVEGDLDEVGWTGAYYVYTDLSFGYDGGSTNPHSNGVLKSILSWGDYMRTQLDNETDRYKYSFPRNRDIEYIAKFSVRNRTGLEKFFMICLSLKEVPKIENTFNITSLYFTFYGCKSLKDVDSLSSWDISNITDLRFTFSNCESLKNVDGLSNWDISNITSLQSTFSDCQSLLNVDGLSDWDTSNVTSLRSIFEDCQSLLNVDGLSDWDISNITDLQFTFHNCQSLRNVNGLSNWDTSNVTTLYYTFRNCQSLLNIDGLSNWNISNVTNLVFAFEGCKSLSNIHGLSNWDISFYSGHISLFRFDHNLRLGVPEFLDGFNFNSNTNTRYIDLSELNLGYHSLLDLFNNLGSVTGTKELRIKDNPGTGFLTATDLNIITSKGWTVVT